MSVEESNWEACVEFCKVTGLQDDDISIAQFYLEETDWKVEVWMSSSIKIWTWRIK